KKKDYSGARTSFEQVLKENPEDIRALGFLASSYTEQNQGDKALKKLREHASRWPKSGRVQAFVGEWLLARGERAEARSAFVAAKAAVPNSAKADLAQAQLDLLDGNLDSAQKTLSAL